MTNDINAGGEADVVSSEYLKECFSYNKDTGKVFWKKRPAHHYARRSDMVRQHSTYSGNLVGGVGNHGYLTVFLRGKGRLLHRLIFCMENGYYPEMVDHINHNRTDNRLRNLVAADPLSNSRSASKNRQNTSGLNGVYWDKQTNKWRTWIYDRGNTFNLGRFADKEDAYAVRRDAESHLGYHPNHGLQLGLPV